MELEVDPTQIALEALPTDWALQKPLAVYDRELVNHLIKQNRIIAEKKYNGHRIHIVVNNQGEVLCHSRGNKAVMNAYIPQTVHHIESLRLPTNTVLDGEIYIPNKGEKENTDLLQKVISCGDTELGKQREAELSPQIALFDCISWGGENLVLKPYKDRFERCAASGKVHSAEVMPIKDLDDGLSKIRDHGIEGLVLWDALGPHKLNTAGNTKRGRAYKLKPEIEEDLLALGFKEGTGQGSGMVGTLRLGKKVGNQVIDVGEVGSGLTQIQKIQLTNTAIYPFVVEVKHFGYDDKGRVTMPRVNKIHTDKTPEEYLKS